MSVEQVIIEFIPDTSQLPSAEKKLEDMGKIDQKSAVIFKATNDQLRQRLDLTGKITLSVTKEQSAVNKLVASMKVLSGESKKAVEGLLKLSTDEIVAGFDKAAVSVDDYVEALHTTEGAAKKTTESTVGLRAQLKGMIEELARLKLAGLDQSEAYRKLAEEAGNLTDTIGDVRSEVNRLGSDTSTFDGLIAGAQGLAGGFAAAQGAVALFGGSSDELQETLVKVSGAMAVLQGLQQISTLTEKESALSLLFINTQRKIQNAQLVIETGLQSRSVVVRGLATIAQKALNAAMSANPIAIVITALTTVIGLFALYANGAKKAAREQANLNSALSSANEGLDGEIAGLNRANAARLSELESAGAKQSDLQRANANTQVQIEQARQREIQKIDQKIAQNRNVVDEESVNQVKELQAKRDQLANDSADAQLDIEKKNIEGRKQIMLEGLQDAVDIRQAEIDKILSLGGKNTGKEYEARKQLLRAEANLEILNAGENSTKIIAIRAKLNESLRQVDIEAREQRQKQSLAALETQLIKEQDRSRAINERESQSEIDIKKKIILETAKFESEADGLSQSQRTAIRLKGIKDAADLQKEFSKKSNQEALQDLISLNEAELSRVGIAEEEKLNLRIDNIIAAAAIEEENNKGLSSKIKEINAKRDADVKAARLQSIQETLAFELRVNDVANAAQSRNTERMLSAQDAIRNAPNNSARRLLEQQLGIRRLSLEQEANLINEQTQIQLDALNLQKQALRDSFKQGLISRKDYSLSQSELVDKEAQAVEDGEERKRRAVAETLEAQKRMDRQRIELAIDIANQVAGVAAGLNDLQTARASQRIDAERAKIDELKAAGAITEKEAILRMKKVDAEEKRIKYEAAVRDKQLAIFNAVIATAAGVAKASPVVPLMILAGALGAAQIALITARPIPKFAKGKKDRYQGLGQVGEAGSEIIERNGQMFVTKKPTIVWLGASDKVYNPKETRAILNKAIPAVNNKVINNTTENKQAPIDYEKLGKSIGKHTSTSLNIDGYRDFIKDQNSFTTYLNNRRGY